MRRLRFLLAMAWRESRASRRRLLLFASAISIGVAALVAISSFTANLETAVRKESRALLGGDLVLSSSRPFTPPLVAILDSAQGAGIGVTWKTTFSSMAWVRRVEERSRLADVRAVGRGFPFYGDVVTNPAGRWGALDSGRVAVVDTSLLIGLGAHLGDSLVLGNSAFAIVATVGDVPGRFSGDMSSFGSQVYIPERYVRETGLIVFGSRVRYQALLRFDTPRLAQRFDARHGKVLRQERVRSETAQETEENLTSALRNLETFLQFVGLIALLLGGIGVASGITAFLAGKQETIAVLRCLGAPRPLVFTIYLVQAIALGVVAAAAGVGLGVVVQLALPHLLQSVLPLDVNVRLEPVVLLAGLGIGVGTAVLFALRPLIEVRLVSPLQAIRHLYEGDAPLPRDPYRLLATGALLAGILALSMARNEEPKVGLAFAAAIVASVVVLTLAARLAVMLARRLSRHGGFRRAPYVVRQGLANLHRPRNQSRAVVTALGFGVGLLATLYLVEANLLRQVLKATAENRSRPNLVFIDIQRDQIRGFEETVHASGPRQTVPIVPMRISAINGRTADQLLGDTGQGRPQSWTLRREYRSTWRDSLVGTETLVRGRWWHGRGEAVPDSAGTPVFPLSLSTEVTQDLHVVIGDRITWDIQGRRVETRLVAVRAVDWARFEPNFFAVFPSAALADGPASFVVLLRLDDATRRAVLQRAVAERYPNVIAFDIGLVQRTVQRIFDRVAVAIRFMAAFSLAIGTLVLLGAVAAGRLQRIREGALLKTLGATRRQLTRILLTEYVALGLLAALVGIGLASAGAWAFTKWVLELPFAVPALPLAAVLLGTAALVALVGVTASRDVFRRTAIEVLRDV